MTTGPMLVIRLSELKLPLSDLPLPQLRAADAPAETEADRHAVPHPIETLRQMAAQALGLAPSAIATLDVFKRSFDARKKLLVVYIVDVTLADPTHVQIAVRLGRKAGSDLGRVRLTGFVVSGIARW